MTIVARASCESLEPRRLLAVPAPPVIFQPLPAQVSGTFNLVASTNPNFYSDPDGHAWHATQWRIFDQSSGQLVWDSGFRTSPAFTLYRVDLSHGTFVGSLAGRTELNYGTNYRLAVRYRDANGEVSDDASRDFSTAGSTQPVHGGGAWLSRPGYVVEPVQFGLRLPVNIAFVPNPGTGPQDPLYYIAGLYGEIDVVRRDGTRQTFASGLLDFNPQGPIPGTGESGLIGLTVERDPGNPSVYHLYVSMLWDNGAPPPGSNHYPKVERITSAPGGLTLSSRSLLLNMQPETQTQFHQVSSVSIGPDSKLYVHMGDGFNAAAALNLDQFRGKVLRMNKDGTAPTDNPFYNPANGITAADYAFTYGMRNPTGGAWRPGTSQRWVVDRGNSVDRMTDLVAGASYGWAGNDAAMTTFSKHVWSPAARPMNADFVDASRFGNSGFPLDASGDAFVALSGATYAAGVQGSGKAIEQFTDLDTLTPQGKLAVAPHTLVRYNGTGRATVAGLAAGPDGLYFTDLFEEGGGGGATAPGAKVWRVRYIGSLPPAPVSALFDVREPSVTFTFSGPLAASSVAPSDLVITNLTTGTSHAAVAPVVFAADMKAVSFILPTNLPDGDYRFVLPAGAVSGDNGVPTTADAVGNNYILAGDANRDRRVNLGDFNILAANFGRTDATYFNGDFNYDRRVNLADFNILASRFGISLSPGAHGAGDSFGQTRDRGDDGDEVSELLA